MHGDAELSPIARSVLISLLMALAIVAPGCGRRDNASAARRFSIIDGTLLSGDRGVVGVADSGQVVCTATMLSQRVALSAAHCLADAALEQLSVFVGADTSAAGTFIPVAEILVHPGYDEIAQADDIGLLLLGQPIVGSSWQPLATPFDSSFGGRAVRIVGYGRTSAGDSSAPRKREGTAAVDAFDERSFTLTAKPSRPCLGDSGGPAFMTIDGVEVVAGITTEGDSKCATLARETRVDRYVTSFIKPFLARAMDGALAPGERCALDSQCAEGACVPALDVPSVKYCATTCSEDRDCAAALSCQSASGEPAYCRHPPPSPGTLGAPCERDADCLSRQCATWDSAVPRTCTTRCFSSNDAPCPSGTSCLQIQGSAIEGCFPSAAASGCAAAGSSGAEPPWLLLILIVCCGVCAARARTPNR